MASDSAEPQVGSASAIVESLRAAETPEAFLRAALAGQVERAGALHGAVWLPGSEDAESVRLLCEEPARVSAAAAAAWRAPVARQAAAVLRRGGHHVERISEPAGRMLEGRFYWAISLPVPLGDAVAAVLTIIVTGTEQGARDYALAAAESLAAQGALYAALKSGEATRARYDELGRAWDLVAAAYVGYPDPDHMALALVNRAKELCDVQRVSLGWVARGKVTLAAVSDQDVIDRRTNLSRALTAAMAEAEELGHPVLFPRDAAEPDACPAQATLADLAEAHALATYPLRAGERVVACVTFERREPRPFTEGERRVQEIACDQLGAALGLARANARGLLARGRDGVVWVVERLLGRGHVTAKLVAVAVMALALVGIFGRWPLTVKGDARLAPASRRAYAAPFDRAVLLRPHVLPGDLVRAGDPLCEFDDEELQLALREARATLVAREKERDVLFSQQKTAECRIATAQCEELEAQIALLEHRIERAVVRAKFDGVVLSGDLRQHVGAPFPMGETLLEVAPLDELLVLVDVEQGDVAHVEVGQQGSFATKARPDLKLPFTVAKIRPLAEARGGATVFVVEARVRNRDGWLRPGMEAAATITGPRRNLAWVLTRKLVNWLRMKLFL